MVSLKLPAGAWSFTRRYMWLANKLVGCMACFSSQGEALLFSEEEVFVAHASMFN